MGAAVFGRLRPYRFGTGDGAGTGSIAHALGR